MRTETVFVTSSVCVTIVAAGAIVASGGPLDPPVGPVESTMKTLDEVEPRTPLTQETTPGDADSVFRINEPGAYYLIGDIDEAPMKHGIEIASAGVTLDLEGFTITGAAGSLDAIHVSAGIPLQIVIRNGFIESWDGDGIDAAIANGAHIEGIDILLCQGGGIRVGDRALVRACAVAFCASGIWTGNDASITDCRVSDMTSLTGFATQDGCSLERCVASGGAGDGMAIGNRGTLRSCVSRENGGVGFLVGAFSSMEDCAASQNGDIGISGFVVAMNGCNASENALAGIFTSDSTVTDCVANGNGLTGIQAVAGSHVARCTSNNNDADGFSIGDASSIDNCLSRNNGGRGIFADEACSVSNNTSVNNDDAGIRVVGREGVVDGNRVINNVGGIVVDDDRNLVIRNVARDNGNRVGDIVVPPLSGDINGDNDPDALGVGTLDPWANFSY